MGSNRWMRRALGWALGVAGVMGLALGLLLSAAAAVRLLQAETGLGLTPQERCCLDVAKGAAAIGAAGVVFMAVGGALLLVAYKVLRWLRSRVVAAFPLWPRRLGLGLTSLGLVCMAFAIAGAIETAAVPLAAAVVGGFFGALSLALLSVGRSFLRTTKASADQTGRSTR